MVEEDEDGAAQGRSYRPPGQHKPKAIKIQAEEGQDGVGKEFCGSAEEGALARGAEQVRRVGGCNPKAQ